MNARVEQTFTSDQAEQRDDPVAIAPAAVLRAAAWPLASVSALVVDEDNLEYDSRVERERRRLWASTAGDPRFMRALSVSNPRLAERVERVYAELATRSRNKALRHLETTLYRTLARAAGRPQPCDLWAGTTLALFGERTAAKPRPRRVHVAPDLRPFAALLTALRSRSPHRERGRFKLNPTLAVGEDTIAWWRRDPDGSTSQHEVRRNGGLEHALRALDDHGIGTFAGHAGALQPLGIETVAARSMLHQLLDRGLLVGGLALTNRFRCPWDTLDRVAEDLDPHVAPAWVQAVDRMRSLAAEVVRLVDSTAPDAPAALRERQRQAAACIDELAACIGVEAPTCPRAPLRCDASVPNAVTLGPQLRNRVRHSIGRYLRFQAEFGIGWDLYRAAVGALEDAAVDLGHVRPVPRYAGAPVWESLLDTLGSDGAPARAWTRVLAEQGSIRVEPTAELRAIGSPVSLYSVAFRSDPREDGGFVLRGSIDSVAAQYARHTPLWSDLGDPLDPFGTWVGEQLREAGRRCGVTPVVLVGPNPGGPNALAQPDLGLQTVELWGTTAAGASLAGARLVVDARSGLPWLEPRTGGRHVVLTVASASIEAGDPVSRALLLTGQLGSPVTDMPAHTVPFRIELGRERPSPRVELDGDIVRTRRTVLADAQLHSLLRSRDAERRFAQWQALARDNGWPPLLLVRRRGRAVLVPRDSALAVASALEGACHDPFVVVEEFEDHAWLPGPDGRLHVAEVGVPFVRPRHAWQAIGVGEDAP